MNTKSEIQTDLARLDEQNGNTSKARALEALADAQEEIASLKDSRREERYLWIVVAVILFDCAFLLNAENSTGPIIIGVLEFAILFILAKRMGIEEAWKIFEKMFHRLGNAVTKED